MEKPMGKYAFQREKFLMENEPELYSELESSGRLNAHLELIQELVFAYTDMCAANTMDSDIYRSLEWHEQIGLIRKTVRDAEYYAYQKWISAVPGTDIPPRTLSALGLNMTEFALLEGTDVLRREVDILKNEMDGCGPDYETLEREFAELYKNAFESLRKAADFVMKYRYWDFVCKLYDLRDIPEEVWNSLKDPSNF